MFSETETGRLASWLAGRLGTPVTSVEVTRLAGGHSSGACRLDVAGAGAAPMRSLVLKAPEAPSVVFRGDACREGRTVDALARMGAPVPAVVGVDDGASTVGRPCFVMEHVDGRSLDDSSPGSYHDD